MGRQRQYASATERKRAQRARDRAGRAHRLDAPTPPVVAVADHADPVGALAEWSRKTLVVPPGHPRSGEPLELLPFAVDWLRETWGAHEAALSTARKNAKSAIAAVLALGYLVGPLRRPGWRGAVASLDKGKASELRRQVAEIAEASHLDVKIRRSPYPGTIESSTGSLDTLSADRTAGHASGYSLVICRRNRAAPRARPRPVSGAAVERCRRATGRSAISAFAAIQILSSGKFLRTPRSCRTSTRRPTTARLTTRPDGARRIRDWGSSRAWRTCAPKWSVCVACRPTNHRSGRST